MEKKKTWVSMAKGFGILGVIAIHTVQRFNVAYVSDIAWQGGYCVQLFFIISAYLTFKSLDKHNGPLIGKAYLKYLAHKLLRLIPMLFVCVCFHFVIYCIQIGRLPDIHDSIYKKVFFTLTFLNGFSYHYINPWGNWYLGDLMIFIVIAPLLKRVLFSPKRAVLFFVVSTVTGYISTSILIKQEIDVTWFFYFWLPRQLPLLATGIIFYYLDPSKGNTEIPKKTVKTFFFILAFGALFPTKWNPIIENHVQYGILFFVFCYILFNAFEKYFRFLEILGDNSYGIYLFHFCFLPIVSGQIEKMHFHKSSIKFLFTYLITLLCSFALSKMIQSLFCGFTEVTKRRLNLEKIG